MIIHLRAAATGAVWRTFRGVRQKSARVLLGEVANAREQAAAHVTIDILGTEDPMAVQQRLYTVQDLWERSHEGGESNRLELVSGEIIEMAPTGGQHGVITSELNYYIQDFIKKHKLGRATGAETGFVLAKDPYTVRAPDVAFITKDRLPRPIPERYFPFAPDLAVEVVSPSDVAQDVRRKVIDYLQAGTRLVWVVYPETQTVDVYRPGQDVRVVDVQGVLQGEDVLPGFELLLGELFAAVGE